MAEGFILSMALTSHIGWQGKLNDVHPILSYVYNGYSVGAFRNSLNHTSLFASKISEVDGVNVQYGFASNYNNRVIPMLVARKPVSEHVNLMISPSYDTSKNKPGLIIGVELAY